MERFRPQPFQPEQQKKPDSRESVVSKIVGIDDDMQDEMRAYFLTRQKKDSEPDFERSLEVQHSPELDQTIAQLNQQMAEFLKPFGVQPYSIVPEKVHIADFTKVPAEQAERFYTYAEKTKAYWSNEHMWIVMLQQYESGRKIDFVRSLVHEMFHAQSFYSLEATTPEIGLIHLEKESKQISFKPRRSGFSIYDRKGKQLFKDTNEALTEELTDDFCARYLGTIPDLQAEYHELEEVREALAKKEGYGIEEARMRVSSIYHDPKDEDGGHVMSVLGPAYSHERNKMHQLLEDLYQKNKADYNDRTDIANMFVRSYFIGEFLPIARLIEKTYGPGSFRELADQTTS